MYIFANKNMKIILYISLIIVIFISINLLVYFFQELLIFYPEKLEHDYKFSFENEFEELNWEINGCNINALHFKAADPRGVILYFHGNAGSLRGWGEVSKLFTDAGYDILMPDYRGYGKSDGKINNQQVLLDDADYAYRYLTRLYDEEKIILYGRSLGCGIATYIAQNKKINKLVLESPYYTFKDLVHHYYPIIPGFLIKYKLKINDWIKNVRCPVYLFHGTNDNVVPYKQSVRLKEKNSNITELVTVKGGGHNDLEDFGLYRQKMMEILE
ncbi:MAG: alpha/beta hydrolase [Cytophagales bacterium]|nr:alpha/beta hydrolase [Cytophagales bacterium]